MSDTDLTMKSCYVSMCDGTRLAVSYWWPQNTGSETPRPAILMTTRYWRAMELKEEKYELQSTYKIANHFWNRGYCLVVCDARGTGASYGNREIELPPREISDIGEVVQWLAEQAWCDGRVATYGLSYTANTTFMSFVTSPQPLVVGVSRAADFDVYRHLMAPGGIVNTWMTDTWGKMTAAEDRNDPASLFAGLPSRFDELRRLAIGVLPVDEDVDRSMLSQAVADHAANFNIREARSLFEFSDSKISGAEGLSIECCSIYHYLDKIEASRLPFVYRAGWYDGGTQLGAIHLFDTLSNPKRIIIGPWNHGGNFRADPFQPGDGTTPEEIPMEDILSMDSMSLDAFFKDHIPPLEMDLLEYYTFNENKWKSTKVWPPPQTRIKRLYLSGNNTLVDEPPDMAEGKDIYQVDPTATTGEGNRWHAQMGTPVYHHDRQAEDRKLLVYDTPPLESDMEITGHPVVHLFVRSSASDGYFFVYLEAVEPDGRVRLITEGQLRAIHRKVSGAPPPYKMFGPYHTFRKKDIAPLVPGEVSELAFDLFPISVLFRKGQKIRMAIAGADRGMFDPITGIESPCITVERNAQFCSCIDLPAIPPR